MIGPLLPDLTHQTQSKISDYSIVFLCKSLGYLLGTVAAAAVPQINYYFALFVVFTSYSVTIMFVQFCENLWQISAVFAVGDFLTGIVDVKGNVAVLNLWPDQSDAKTQSTALHIIHASFSTGALMQGYFSIFSQNFQ